MKYNGKVIDSHCHLHGGYSGLASFMEDSNRLAGQAKLDMVNVAMAPQWDDEYITQNPLGILYKALNPTKVFAYMGFDSYPPQGAVSKPFLEQVIEGMAMGFDGVKMVELKPTVQKRLHVKISDPCYDPVFSYMEEKQIPLLLHVADPETFWSKEQCPEFALKKGWLYENGGYPEKEALYQDTEAMLDRHPNLQVSLAHFYFLSDDIGRAQRIMDRYPNVRFDLTPGTEMYGNFTKTPEAWHDFFIKYQDRIMLGTDNGGLSADGMMPMSEKIDYAIHNVGTVRRFLETADRFDGHGMHLAGIDLPVSALEKIYHLNFEKMVGTQPKKVDMVRANEYARGMAALYENKDVPFGDIAYPLLVQISQMLTEVI
ncbi:MAG: amidohydrolase family protein [Clostridiales bacterium]|nr:amidohydrolase family protein [Clostridiales bacterium]